MDGDLFVTADTERADGVTGLAWGKGQMLSGKSRDGSQRTVDRSLTGELLEHLGGTSESVTRFTDGDVQNELLNPQLLHGVLSLFGRHGCGVSRRR